MVALLIFLNQGVHPSIRREVWEFLLGCYDPKSTFEERDQIRHRRRLQVFLLNAFFIRILFLNLITVTATGLR